MYIIVFLIYFNTYTKRKDPEGKSKFKINNFLAFFMNCKNTIRPSYHVFLCVDFEIEKF